MLELPLTLVEMKLQGSAVHVGSSRLRRGSSLMALLT